MKVKFTTHAATLARVTRAACGFVLFAAVSALGCAVAFAQQAQDTPASPFLGFVREGIHHILIGYDHILFLVCLLLPAVLRRRPEGWEPVIGWREAVWPMLGIVTMFTIAPPAAPYSAAKLLVSIATS